MNRTVAAFLIGIITFVCIADIAAGYLNFGELPDYGAGQPVGSSATRWVYTSVTSEGRAIGIRPGDIVDISMLSVPLRATVGAGRAGDAGASIDVPMLRNGSVVYAHESFVRRKPIALDLVDVLLRLLLAAAGVFLIARGTARDSLYAGLFVCSLAIYEGFAVHYWGAPWVTVAFSLFDMLVLTIPVFGARFLFALALFRENVPLLVKRICHVVSACLFTVFYACSIGSRAAEMFGAQYIDSKTYFIAQMLAAYAALAMFGIAAAYARGRRAGAVRWIFGALLVSIIGPTINWVSIILGVPPPAQGALNATYVVLALVLPYAILARGLVAIDFVFSRALVYTIVLSIVVAIFILAEQLVERAALGRVQSAVVELAVPLILGLSFKWIEGGAERLVERLLYRDKQRAAEHIEALIEDFPHARDLRALTTRVVHDVHRLMNSPFVCIFREADSTYLPVASAGHGEPMPVGADDPVFLRLRSKHAPVQTDSLGGALPRHGAVFPLVVFGTVTGALFAQYRESGERFDPDEMETLRHLAHELAIALLWVEHAPSVTAQRAADARA